MPTGPLDAWQSDPFVPDDARRLPVRPRRRRHERLARRIRHRDRGVRRARIRDAAGSIALLITSDEEGPSIDGTVKVVERLAARGERIDYCIVGEPSSVDALGDMIKNGRRGTLSGTLTVKGVQGHIAYPQLARNPIHLVAPAIAELAATDWDDGNEYFPPTTWQCSNIHAGTGATNVIPGTLEVHVQLPLLDRRARANRCVAALRGRRCAGTASTTSSRGPARASRSSRRADGWSTSRRQPIREVTGVTPELSCTGGTSDGRFIADICREMVELGPVNATIHKLERARARSPTSSRSSAIYRGMLERLLLR